MTSLVLRKEIEGRAVKLKLVRAGPMVISEGVMKPERVQVICPGCGQQVEAVAWDGRVKGYCAVAKQYVDFLIDAQRVPTGKYFTAETRAKISAALTGKHPTDETKAKISTALKRRHSAERGANERPS